MSIVKCRCVTTVRLIFSFSLFFSCLILFSLSFRCWEHPSGAFFVGQEISSTGLVGLSQASLPSARGRVKPMALLQYRGATCSGGRTRLWFAALHDAAGAFRHASLGPPNGGSVQGRSDSRVISVPRPWFLVVLLRPLSCISHVVAVVVIVHMFRYPLAQFVLQRCRKQMYSKRWYN